MTLLLLGFLVFSYVTNPDGGTLLDACEIVGVVFAGIAILVGANEFRTSTKWRKTEFLIAQNREIDTDDDIQYAIRMIDTNQVTDASIESDRTKFNKLLSTLNALAFCVTDGKTLEMADVCENFGWFYTSVKRNDVVKKYCQKNGYKRVVSFAESAETYFHSN